MKPFGERKFMIKCLMEESYKTNRGQVGRFKRKLKGYLCQIFLRLFTKIKKQTNRRYVRTLERELKGHLFQIFLLLLKKVKI